MNRDHNEIRFASILYKIAAVLVFLYLGINFCNTISRTGRFGPSFEVVIVSLILVFFSPFALYIAGCVMDLQIETWERVQYTQAQLDKLTHQLAQTDKRRPAELKALFAEHDQELVKAVREAINEGKGASAPPETPPSV